MPLGRRGVSLPWLWQGSPALLTALPFSQLVLPHRGHESVRSSQHPGRLREAAGCGEAWTGNAREQDALNILLPPENTVRVLFSPAAVSPQSPDTPAALFLSPPLLSLSPHSQRHSSGVVPATHSPKWSLAIPAITLTSEPCEIACKVRAEFAA